MSKYNPSEPQVVHLFARIYTDGRSLICSSRFSTSAQSKWAVGLNTLWHKKLSFHPSLFNTFLWQSDMLRIGTSPLGHEIPRTFLFGFPQWTTTIHDRIIQPRTTNLFRSTFQSASQLVDLSVLATPPVHQMQTLPASVHNS